MTGCGSLWITAYFHNETGQLCHIFLDKGSKGGCNSFMIGLSRLISLAGKKGATIDEIVDQLRSVPACPSYVVRNKTKGDTSPGNCCPSAIANALVGLLRNSTTKDKQGMSKPVKEVVEQHKKVKQYEPCPECGAELWNSGGCNVCSQCGYSKCD